MRGGIDVNGKREPYVVSSGVKESNLPKPILDLTVS